MLYWPDEIAQGSGKEQAIIDQRADLAQREGLRNILHGESTAPGATNFFVYKSTMSTVLDTLYAPIDLAIDVEGRTAHATIPDLVESRGAPIINPRSGERTRSRINLPNGFEYTFAEMGNGSSTVKTGIELDLRYSYGQFNELHMNQDGVIR